MGKNDWKLQGSCVNYDVNLFFDKYEENEQLRPAIEKICSECPVARTCFAVGISQKEYGVWGGVYLEKGKISREFGRHKSREDWAETWKNLTVDKKQEQEKK
jgi:hypothetical protein